MDIPNWDIHGVHIETDRYQAPDGSLSALKIAAVTDNGHIMLPVAEIPAGEITFSVYLRADRLITVGLYLWSAGAAANAVVRLSPEWQRFALTTKHRSTDKALAQIGGGLSFVTGEAIYMWAPQVNTGHDAKDYAVPAEPQPTWLAVKLGLPILSSQEQRLLMLGAAVCLLLLFISTTSKRFGGISIGRAGVNAVRRMIATDLFFARSAIVYSLIVIGTLIAMETASLVASTARIAKDQPIAAAFASTWERAPFAAVFEIFGATPPPLILGESTIFSPLTQVARLPGESLPPLLINQLGLIDNENPDPVLRTMPAKAPGMTRIALYGGSTAMGIGAPYGKLTIAAQLERILNENAKPGSTFQVLNFGHGGGQTFSDLGFLAAMGSKLDVDVSMGLNGFNDAFFATESSRIYSTYDYVINWSDFSYHSNNVMNGLAPPNRITIPLLPFTSLLFNDLVSARYVAAADQRKRFFADMPMRQVTQYFDTTRHRDELLRENLRFMAGYFINRKQVFLSYLQPHPLQYRRLLDSADPGPTEAELVRQSIQRLTRHDPREYERRMVAMFDAYAEQYKLLGNEYRRYPNIRFIDLRDALKDLPVAAYIDIAHYSPAAQRRLAERMFEDLNQFEAIRSGLERRKNSPGSL